MNVKDCLSNTSGVATPSPTRQFHSYLNEQIDELQIQELTSESNELKQAINQERVARSSLRDELAMTKRFYHQIEEVNSVLQQELEAERENHQRTVNEVCRLINWCHRVDSLVDTMRLEEDKERKVHDRSRYIGEIIKDIELRLGTEYEARLKERDKQIANLQKQLDRANMGLAGRKRRGRNTKTSLE
ncbi:hypothetical protein TMEN_6775 [Trichophyton mentagrophytes]|nr:hypothetical protein TMEN_6775 [Trichophyton mentagrophytes]